MVAQLFRIREGVMVGLLSPPGKRLWRAGPSVVRVDELGDKLKGYLESGFVYPLGESDRPVELQVLAGDSVRDPSKPTGRVPLTPPEVLGRKSPKSTRIVQKAKFDVDPRTLEGLDLEALNLRIIGIDPNEKTCKTVEDALNVLTQDFRSPVKASDVDVHEGPDGKVRIA